MKKINGRKHFLLGANTRRILHIIDFFLQDKPLVKAFNLMGLNEICIQLKSSRCWPAVYLVSGGTRSGCPENLNSE